MYVVLIIMLQIVTIHVITLATPMYLYLCNMYVATQHTYQHTYLYVTLYVCAWRTMQVHVHVCMYMRIYPSPGCMYICTYVPVIW